MKKRVKIPSKKPSALLELAKKVHSQHLADGEASLLQPLKWSEISLALQDAILQHENAERTKRESLQSYQQRDLSLQTVREALRDSRDILTGVYKKEMKVLGRWGYEVFEVRNVKPSSQDSDQT